MIQRNIEPMARQRKRHFAVKLDYRALQDKILELQQHFHRHPELAFQEFETTAFIVNRLEKLGYEVQRMDPTGCTAMLPHQKKRRTMIIRVEMDAVPIHELTNSPHKSMRDGVMHACGHDANMAVALVLAEIIAADNHPARVNVKFVFEPAEEIGKGTSFMLKQGVLKSHPVDECVMFHFVNKENAGMEVNDGVASATLGKINVRIKGKSTHWADNTRGIDAIMVAGKVITMVEMLNQTYQLNNPFRIGLGTIKGGTSSSAMAGEVVMNGNIRTVTKAEYDEIGAELYHRLKEIEKEVGADIELHVNKTPVLPIVNDQKLIRRAINVGQQVWGASFSLETTVYLAGDNAYQYLEEVPGILMIFAMPGDVSNPLHNPHFVLNDTFLWKALETLHGFILKSNEEPG